MDEDTARDLAQDLCQLADGYQVANVLPPAWPKRWDRWTVILATEGAVWEIQEARTTENKPRLVLGLGSRN